MYLTGSLGRPENCVGWESAQPHRELFQQTPGQSCPPVNTDCSETGHQKFCPSHHGRINTFFHSTFWVVISSCAQPSLPVTSTFRFITLLRPVSQLCTTAAKESGEVQFLAFQPLEQKNENEKGSGWFQFRQFTYLSHLIWILYH